MRVLLPALATGLAGLAAGWFFAPRPAPAVVVEHVPVPAAARPLECPPAEAPSNPDFRLRWCEAQLGLRKEQVELVRVPWPDVELGVDDPSTFPADVTAAVEACGARVERTDCTDYPCMAIVDGDPSQLESCPALAEALPDLTVISVPLRCPSGDIVDVQLVANIEEELTKIAVEPMVGSDPDPMRLYSEQIRLVTRRMDATAVLARDLCP